jgi:RimJ/RimL family protein N-acetyltransferase
MTADITLRPYALDDAPRLFEAARESIAEVYPWLPWCRPEYTPEEARDWVEKQVPLFAEGTAYSFVVAGAGGRFLGGCGLNQLDPLHRRANLGYWVRTSAAGRGTASAAVRHLAAWAFANTDLVRLEIVAAVDNAASIRVAEKSGAVREGIARSRLLIHGVPHDAVVFSIVREASAVPRNPVPWGN